MTIIVIIIIRIRIIITIIVIIIRTKLMYFLKYEKWAVFKYEGRMFSF